MYKRWANSTLTVVGGSISIKPSFPVAVLEERDPGGGPVEAVSLGGGGFAACSAAHQDSREAALNLKPLISKKMKFDLCMLYDERMKEGFRGSSPLPLSLVVGLVLVPW